MMADVTINTFEESGKWNCEYTYRTNIPVYESQQLIDEATKKYNLHNQDFTISVEHNEGLNFRLVKAH